MGWHLHSVDWRRPTGSGYEPFFSLSSVRCCPRARHGGSTCLRHLKKKFLVPEKSQTASSAPGRIPPPKKKTLSGSWPRNAGNCPAIANMPCSQGGNFLGCGSSRFSREGIPPPPPLSLNGDPSSSLCPEYIVSTGPNSNIWEFR